MRVVSIGLMVLGGGVIVMAEGISPDVAVALAWGGIRGDVLGSLATAAMVTSEGVRFSV